MKEWVNLVCGVGLRWYFLLYSYEDLVFFLLRWVAFDRAGSEYFLSIADAIFLSVLADFRSVYGILEFFTGIMTSADLAIKSA